MYLWRNGEIEMGCIGEDSHRDKKEQFCGCINFITNCADLVIKSLQYRKPVKRLQKRCNVLRFPLSDDYYHSAHLFFTHSNLKFLLSNILPELAEDCKTC